MCQYYNGHPLILKFFFFFSHFGQYVPFKKKKNRLSEHLHNF